MFAFHLGHEPPIVEDRHRGLGRIDFETGSGRGLNQAWFCELNKGEYELHSCV